MSLVYVDTSVLAKRYVRSEASDAIDDFFDDSEHCFALSELCLVEMESVLARHARESRSGGPKLHSLRLRFESDLRLGFFEIHPLTSAVILKARQLVADGGAPLATLDALHLSTAIDIAADAVATDDRQLMRATKAHGLNAISFIQRA